MRDKVNEYRRRIMVQEMEIVLFEVRQSRATSIEGILSKATYQRLSKLG
tara:strand:+ start:297 stop:443 length:147 start_codon:yes stop_codon:yes gene_type:complete